MNPTEWSALLVLATASSFTHGPNTALSTALAANRGLLRSMHFVCAVSVGFGFFSNLTYALIGSMLRQWLSQGQRLLHFNRCMAAALVSTAAWIVWSAR
jgi:hypothetical protein